MDTAKTEPIARESVDSFAFILLTPGIKGFRKAKAAQIVLQKPVQDNGFKLNLI